MLAPKRAKFRKAFRGKRRGVSIRGSNVDFGEYGLKAIGVGWVSSRQIEAIRRVLTRNVKKGGKIWIRIFPDKPITKKGNETPMGGGKGAVDHFVTVVKPGTMLFEMDGVKEDVARDAMRLAAYKLPVKTRFIVKENA